MISQHCGLSRDQFVALSHGHGGPAVVRVLGNARYSSTLLLLKYVTDHDRRNRAAFDLLVSLAGEAPDAVRAVLSHPTVGAWLRRTTARLLDGGADHTAELAFVAAAAATRVGVPATVDLPVADRIPLPSVGTGTGPVAGGPTPVIELEWRPTPRIAVPGGCIELADWAPGWRPDGLALSETVNMAEWRRSLRAGWRMLTDDHPDVAAELAGAVSMITPLRQVGGSVSSATVADAYGCVFVSLVRDPEQLALTLAHELQHLKLAALLDMYRLLHRGSGEEFYAPWRTDPRPAHGLLHGCYAYVGVTGFWRTRAERTGDPHAYREFARWRTSTRDATRTLLDSGLATDLGRLFLTGMIEVLESWCTEDVPPGALAAAAKDEAQHRDRWLRHHGAP